MTSKDEQNSLHHTLALGAYIGVLGLHAASLLYVAVLFLITLKKYEHRNYLSHKRLILGYSFFIYGSLAIKFALSANLFEYSTQGPFVVYTLSDLVILTLFCAFKKDEDCFYCFNRCDDIVDYSIF